ncbi:MAG: potassium-transporting ATPase subunit C [Acidimicrobiales bacterium]
MHVLAANLRRSILLAAVFFALLGLVYPLAEYGIGQAAFSRQVDGSLSTNGSSLVGQRWDGPKWFQGRPDGDDPMATGGSNLGPRSKVLVQVTKNQIEHLRKEGIVPTPDLVTTSGSGVDPDISPAAAYAQVGAVAGARGVPVGEIRRLVAKSVTGAEFGFLGASYVNVLQLNESVAELR